DHEGDLLGLRLLGGHDEVALVLAVLVVDDDDQLAGRKGRDAVLDAVEGHGLVVDDARLPAHGQCRVAMVGTTRRSIQLRTSARRMSSFITSSSMPSSQAMSLRLGSWCRLSSRLT